MRPRALLLAVVVLLAGCADAEEPVTDASTTQTPAAATSPGAEGNLVVPIMLDGSTATQAYVCVMSAPPCAYRSIVDGKSDVMFGDLVGTLVSGKLSLVWTASGPATEDLATGIMLMGGRGDDCASVDLGSFRGPSPIEIEVKSPQRPFCEGEVLHAWVSNGIYVGEDPAYAQLDVDQAFHLEGNVTIVR